MGNVTANLTVTGCTSISSVSVASPPPGTTISFPYGLLTFTATGCTNNGTATVQVQYTGAGVNLANTQVYQCNGNTCSAYAGASLNSGTSTITYTVTDGGHGDEDGLANGSITDPVGPGIPATPIPTLPRWAEFVLAAFVGLGALLTLRRAQA